MKRLDSAKIAKLRTLKKQGKTLDEIKMETGVSTATISKYTKNIKADNPLEETATQTTPQIPFGEEPQTPQQPEDYEVEFIGSRPKAQEALIEVEGIPVNRKISLTPKNLLMWDCFRKTYPQWDGDLSNFINESMDCTFKALKMNMKITIGEMIQ